MNVTKTDLLLLSRIGKLLGEQAAEIHRAHSPWSAEESSVKAKRTYDRILREQRDLADVASRLKAQATT